MKKLRLRSAQHAADRRPVLLYGVTTSISADTLLRGQLEHMVERGYDVHLATNMVSSQQSRPGIVEHHIPMSRDVRLASDLVALVEWIRLLKKIKPNIVNVSTPKASLLGLVAAFITGVPTRVYLVRGLRYEGATPRLRLLLTSFERLNCILATNIIAVGFGVAYGLKQVTKSNKIIVLGSGSSNGVDVDQIDNTLCETDADSLRGKLGLLRGVPTVMFVGRPDPDKGFDTLKMALDRMVDVLSVPSMQLLCVGHHVPSWREEVLVSSTGWVEDVTPYYSVADLLCLPTYREGYPNVVLEANVAGLAVVTTSATGADESVDHGKTGLKVDPGEVTELSHALFTLITDTALRNSLAANGRHRAATHFTRTRIWDALAELYSSPDTNPVDSNEIGDKM